MLKRIMALCCAIVALPSVAAMAAELPDTIERIRPAIVGIGTYQETRRPPGNLLGTGFAVQDGRYVLTNAHVVSQMVQVEKKEYLAVFVGTGPSPAVRRAERVAVDYTHDLALLKIDGKPIPALVLGDSMGVREGDACAFTGFPIGSVLGLYPATHHGIVSTITPIVTPVDRSRDLDPVMISRLRTPYSVFQLDATAYPGNSGSPLYDPKTGIVVGIVNGVFVKGTKEKALTEPSGITYAMPINYARDLIRDHLAAP